MSLGAASKRVRTLPRLLAIGCVAIAAMAIGCAHRRVGSSVPRDSDLASSVGHRITFEGKAENAFLGAVVLVERSPIYVTGMSEWKVDLRGRRVRIDGVLRLRKLAPDPVVGPNGEQSEGMVGDAYVIDEATWQLADDR